MIKSSSSNSNALPDWLLFEMSLEKRKKVSHRESQHPYTIINDFGEVTIPGAKILFISFDKHSKTHKSDRLTFGTSKGGHELGSFGGDELKDKTIIVHGSQVFYEFHSVGGDHECTCNGCGNRVHGCRYHCTICDDYDLCEKCVKKPNIHGDTHLFLKIRRPVDCVPAALPHLYSNKWTTTGTFRGTMHTGVKCSGCSVMPIRGIRYWCENCEDFNLCAKCAEEEYKHHDRMHVFLRVVRPLPPKNTLPNNALPYGLVYEKDMDTHWGYLFSVSSSDSMTTLDDSFKTINQIQNQIKSWNHQSDVQLVNFVENHCNGWQSLEFEELNPKATDLANYSHLTNQSIKSIRYRFTLLKLLNRKLSRILHMMDLSSCDLIQNVQEFDSPNNHLDLPTLICHVRDLIFRSVKMDLWQHTIVNTLVDTLHITLKLNRHKAAEDISDPHLRSMNSMFNQAYNQFRAINPKVLCRKGGAWKVTFVGEAADDYGGPFRDSLTQMCVESQSDQMDMLVHVPNHENGVGENREKFIPNPRAVTNKHFKWFQFMGEILAVGLLSKNVMPLDLPSLFWKHMVRDRIELKDLEAIDQSTVNSLREISEIDQRGITALDFDSIMIETFTTKSSDGKLVELIPGGSQIPVTFYNRHDYVKLVQDYRLNVEMKLQIDAIRQGLYSVVTPRYFSVFSWHELEMLVCGSPTIDLDVLKRHTIYESYTPTCREVRDFWQCLESFDANQRSLYLRFVWGRSRLPITEEGFANHHMKIQKLEKSNPDQMLPLSHTCFFSIELPAYSSYQIMRSKLLYAIMHCTAIDTDFTTVANEARNINIL
ncbi:hypothetical protein AKO1_009425, partial [Acrasis kona]